MPTFNQLRKSIRPILDSGIAVELRSAPGRGKSEFVEQTIAEQSRRDGFQWGLAKCFLATMTPPDLLGFMIPGKRETTTGETIRVSEFTMPPWMTTTDGRSVFDYPRGILFLDEFGQGEADVKRAAAELLLNGRIGQWQLPKGWSVIAASNRAQDRSGVTKSFDFVINRRLELDITDDLASWEDWAYGANVSPVAIAFAAQNPQVVFADSVPDKQGPWCTPRSLVMVDRLLRGFADHAGRYPTDGHAIELAAGMIGQGAAAQLFGFIRLDHEMPRYDDILAKPKTVRVPDAADAQMLVCYTLAARVTEETVDQVVTYMERFPAEFSVTFAKAASRRDPDLVDTAAFGGWCARNHRLMAAIQQV